MKSREMKKRLWGEDNERKRRGGGEWGGRKGRGERGEKTAM